jgi:hypothetical protein
MPTDINNLTPIDIARANWPVNCSHCGTNAVRVLETRPNRDSIRRRKHCSNCGHRETTYEIGQVKYKELEVLARLRKTLAGIEPDPVVLYCQDCQHWDSNTCDFGLPEAGGSFASDCSTYATTN